MQQACPEPSPQAEELARNGFIVVSDITDLEDIETIRELAEGLFERRAGFEQGLQFDMVRNDDEAGGVLRSAQVLDPRFFEKKLKKTRFYANAHVLAKTLLGPKATLYFDHVIKKTAVDGAETPWHQDEAFRDPAFDYSEISIWLPLQTVDERNGCLRFAPGSNRGEVLPHRRHGGDERAHALECYDGFDPADAVACPLSPGQCTVHTGRTLHGAGANLSDTTRMSYTIVFQLPKRRRFDQREFPWRTSLVEGKTPRIERRRRWMRSPRGLLTEAIRRLGR